MFSGHNWYEKDGLFNWAGPLCFQRLVYKRAVKLDKCLLSLQNVRKRKIYTILCVEWAGEHFRCKNKYFLKNGPIQDCFKTTN